MVTGVIVLLNETLHAMSNQEKSSISEAEWKVMRVLWAKSPQPAYDIIATLSETENWRPNTIKTLLGRLHRKGALAAEKYKNLYLYRPDVSEEECVAVESQSFIDRVFGGAAKPMMVHFVKHKKLSPEEITELRKILDEAEES